MSKQSRRRNRLLATMVALTGASKLGLLPTGKSKSDIYGKAQKARKAFKSTTGPALDNVKSSVKVLADESLTPLNPRTRIGQVNRRRLFEARQANDAIKDEVIKKTRSKKLRGRIGFSQNRSSGGTMIKARGGGMAKTKPTKMY
jgi:hypothetical protein